MVTVGGLAIYPLPSSSSLRFTQLEADPDLGPPLMHVVAPSRFGWKGRLRQQSHAIVQ